MKILVTGAAGFLGSKVVDALVAAGEDVVAVVRPSNPAPCLTYLINRIRVERVELTDRGTFSAVLRRERPECVVHLAWYTDPRAYLTSPRNVESLSMTLGVVEESLSAGCRKLVGIGTCREYASLDRPCRESDPCDPRSLYAACKHAAWLVGRALVEASGGELAWGRIFHLHGPGENPGRLLPAVAAALREGRSFDLTSGEQVRDHLHVRDAARAIALLCAPGVTGPVNICSGEPVRLRDVLSLAADILRRPGLLNFGVIPHRTGEEMFLVGDASKLLGLGFRPLFPTLRAGLRDALEIPLEAA